MVLACIATTGAAAELARADTADTSNAAKRIVDVVIVGSPQDADPLKESLRELLARLGLGMRVTTVDRPDATPSSAPDIVARVDIDLRSPDSTIVVLTDTRNARAPLRRVVAREGSRALLLEETAHVVQAGTESLLAGELAAKAPAAASSSPPSAPPPSPSSAHDALPTPVAPARWGLALATFANGESFAKDLGIVFGAGVAGRLDLGRGARRPALWLAGAYHLPFGNNGLDTARPIELRVSVWSIRLVPSIEVFASDRFFLEVGAGGGVDIFTLSPGAVGRLTDVDANRTDASPIFTAMVAAHLAVGPTTTMFIAGTLDADLSRRNYVVASSAGNDAVVSSLGVRPGVTLGFTFDVARSGEAR